MFQGILTRFSHDSHTILTRFSHDSHTIPQREGSALYPRFFTCILTTHAHSARWASTTLSRLIQRMCVRACESQPVLQRGIWCASYSGVFDLLLFKWYSIQCPCYHHSYLSYRYYSHSVHTGKAVKNGPKSSVS
jgi:hypothetical protein